MKNNNNKGFIITIVIMAIMLISLGGYLVYDKLLSNNDEKKIEETKNNEEEVKEEVVSQEEQDKLVKIIEDLNNYNLGRYDNLNPIELSNQDKLAFISFIVYNNKLNGEDGSILGLKGSDVSNIYKKYFGSSSSIVNDDIKTGDQADAEVLFKYDKANNVYVQTHFGNLYLTPPGYAITTPYNFLISSVKKNNIYTLKVNSIYRTPCDGMCAPDSILAGNYKDANDKKNPVLTDISGWYDDDGNIIQSKMNEDYNKIKDKLPVYTYTFKLENGNYVLQSKIMEAK